MSSRLPAIRATPEQTALLKAAYTASHSPSSQGIQELSQQTGLPSKWIGRWFSRQRTRSRKVGETIDLTTVCGGPTRTARPLAPVTMKIKVEYQEAETIPSSTLDSTAAAQNSIGPKPAKSTRRKGPLPKKPQVELAAVQPLHQDTRVSQMADNTTAPKAGTPTHLRTSSEDIKNSIQSQSTSADMSMASIYTSNGYFSPLDTTDAQSNTSCSVSYNDYSDPVSTEGDSPYETNLVFESVRLSSPASSDARGPITGHVQSLTDSDPLCGLPLLSAEFLSGQPVPRNLSSRALALHAALYNNSPAAYHTMLSSYAALLPALFPALTSMFASTNPIGASETPVLASSPSYPLAGTENCPSRQTQIGDIPRQSPPAVDDDVAGALDVNSSLTGDKLVQDTPWISDSDSLDFSGLYYDYAPLGHLQERLEPFRFPESTYLFGREAVGNHLLDERLAVEEPFQAAMGLVLLSKLGLQW